MAGHPLPNEKHEQFARLVATGNHTRVEVYQLIYGCGLKTAQNQAGPMSRRPAVRERITQIKAGLAAQSLQAVVFEREWLHHQLKDVIERCMTGKPVYGPDGKPTGRWTFDPSNALKAIELADRTAKGGPTLVKETRTRRLKEEDPMHGKSDAEYQQALDRLRERLDALDRESRAAGGSAGDGEGDEVPPSSSLPPLQ